jgi:nitroreductase
MTNTLQLLHTRRSVVARNLGEPGPDAVQLENILRAGLRVPDHGKLAPWRFIVIQGAARGALGEHLVTA